jgi:Tfp pilus assembly protein PilE
MKHQRRTRFPLLGLLITSFVTLVLAAPAVPKKNTQLLAAHEMAAIRQITTIHQGQFQYYEQFGKYASTPAELAGAIPNVLADGKNSGYTFSVAATSTGYTVNAVPDSFGTSGRRTFFSDQTRVIRNSLTQEPATATSPEIK